MTKLSHGCGWCFLPAVWAGEAALKFIVDIIIWNYPLNSDWLTELPNIFGLPGSGKTSPDGWLGACGVDGVILPCCFDFHVLPHLPPPCPKMTRS
jgi:hypothetical protein